MMTDDLIRLFYDLLPGFLAAWVYYGLTAHPKPSPFERVIQALIFTVIVRALFIVFRGPRLPRPGPCHPSSVRSPPGLLRRGPLLGRGRPPLWLHPGQLPRALSSVPAGSAPLVLPCPPPRDREPRPRPIRSAPRSLRCESSKRVYLAAVQRLSGFSAK